MTELYYSCTLCPNKCAVNRLNGETGICGQTNEVRIAWCGLHRGEEPPVSGKKGSGMIFFCGCPLHCQYCQNYQISTENSYSGKAYTVKELSHTMLDLQNFGAATINLVTGTHFIPSIAQAVRDSKDCGLKIPVVWNSSGYETVKSLRLIDSYIDLYLMDIKAIDEDTASRFCGTACYTKAALETASFLKRRRRITDLDKCSGTIIRHLVFPGTFCKTLEFLKWYRDNLKECCKLSLMTQFVPPKHNPGFIPVTDYQYRILEEKLDEYDIDGFIQEREENEILWIPDFRRENPFPAGFADPLPSFTAHP